MSRDPDQVEDDLADEVAAWIACLRTGTLDDRIIAAREIGCAIHGDGETRAAAIAALLDALEPPALAKAALELLGDFGDDAAVGVDRVTPLLAHADPQLRYWATFALARMGPAAKRALPALEALRTDPEDGPRYGALDAIRRLTA